MIQKLARYWMTDFDWRKAEAKLNALPQFVTEIDGVDIQFAHIRSPHAGPASSSSSGCTELIRQQAPIVDRLFEIELLDGGAEAFVFTFG